MLVNLLTDAPNHNLALMKISAYHKSLGDTVLLNDSSAKPDIRYGSWLFNRLQDSDVEGGSAVDCTVQLPPEMDTLEPDYDLFGCDYSLGYTWRDCPRSCSFCVVPKLPKTGKHQSIWTFHNRKFNKICLLNNNTFSDPDWEDTFEEIWDARLTVLEHGFDLRYLDDPKVIALKRTKFDRQIHFAWDDIRDEQQVREGLELLRLYKMRGMVYVLIGYNSSIEEDLYRCQVVNDYKFDPYPMPYNGGTKENRAFKRFICLRAYRKYKSLSEAWQNYNRK